MKKLFPFQISTKFIDNGVLVQNKTENDWNSATVSVVDGYAQDLVIKQCTINSGESLFLPFQDDFKYSHFENGIDFRMYFEHELVYRRNLNSFRKKAFVLFSNKQLERLTEQLIIGLTRYSENDIYYYTVDFDSELEYPNLHLKRLDYQIDEELHNDARFITLLKPDVFLQAISDGIEDAMFIDSDVQVKPNIDSAFELLNETDPTVPILNRNYWQSLFVEGKYIPGKLLCERMGYNETKQFQGHGITNIFLFRKEMQETFLKWRYWCKDTEIVNSIMKQEYLHDELIFNLLCWVEKKKHKLSNLLFNVRDHVEVKMHYFIDNAEGQAYLDFNSHQRGHMSQSHAHYDRSTYVGFHCVKDVEAAKRINEFIFAEFKNGESFDKKILEFFKG